MRKYRTKEVDKRVLFVIHAIYRPPTSLQLLAPVTKWLVIMFTALHIM